MGTKISQAEAEFNSSQDFSALISHAHAQSMQHWLTDRKILKRQPQNSDPFLFKTNNNEHKTSRNTVCFLMHIHDRETSWQWRSFRCFSPLLSVVSHPEVSCPCSRRSWRCPWCRFYTPLWGKRPGFWQSSLWSSQPVSITSTTAIRPNTTGKSTACTVGVRFSANRER